MNELQWFIKMLVIYKEVDIQIYLWMESFFAKCFKPCGDEQPFCCGDCLTISQYGIKSWTCHYDFVTLDNTDYAWEI